MLCTLLESHAAERPQHAAVVGTEGVLTWHELHERVRRLAAALAARGIRRGDSVALAFANQPTLIVAFLAVARLGAVAVPLSVDAKPAEFLSALQESGCTVLLANDRLAWCQEGELPPPVPSIPASTLDRWSTDFVEPVTAPRPADSDDVLELTSSGTTGRPKRVFRTHAHLLRLAAAYVETVGITADDRILAVIPLLHGHGLCSALLASLHSGATLHVVSPFDRRETLRHLSRERITVFPAVPFVYSVLADTRTREPIDLSALRLCITGGAPLTREQWTKVRDKLGLTLRQSYGSSEAGAVTVNMDDDPAAAIESVGRPLRGVEVRVCDSEIEIRSPAAAEWTRPKGDSSCGPKTRLPAADGWIRTGDLGRLEAGRLYVTGRRGLMINVAGRKVHPEEVERVLASFPQVREAVVVAARDGYGEESVRALVVADPGCDVGELLTFCRQRLADYKVPRAVEFRGSLPRTATGKISRCVSSFPASET